MSLYLIHLWLFTTYPTRFEVTLDTFPPVCPLTAWFSQRSHPFILCLKPSVWPICRSWQSLIIDLLSLIKSVTNTTSAYCVAETSRVQLSPEWKVTVYIQILIHFFNSPIKYLGQWWLVWKYQGSVTASWTLKVCRVVELLYIYIYLYIIPESHEQPYRLCI